MISLSSKGRLIDDIILALPQDQIENNLNSFNSYNPHIKFTCEEETDECLPFLDMTVIKCVDNVLQKRWYRKPISSIRFIQKYLQVE